MEEAILKSMMERTKKNLQRTVNNTLVSVNHATGVSKEFAIAIVPLAAFTFTGSRSVQTYTFLDPGSLDTVCTEILMNQLNAKGCSTEVFFVTNEAGMTC